MGELSRRRFLQITGAAGVTLLAPVRFPGRAFAVPGPGGSLDPLSIPKYLTPLVIPPQMPRTSGGRVDHYEIAVRQFAQQILPDPLPATTVWSYGSATHPETFNYPAFTIEARHRRPVHVRWVNELVDRDGALPAAPAARGPHAVLGQPAGRGGGPGQPADVHHHPGPVRRAGAHRHPPARRPRVRPQRRLRRGLVPAGRRRHPGRLRHRGHLLRLLPPAVPARRRVAPRQRGVPVPERPAGRDAVVPRPHAGHDPAQRLRRPGRLLPAAPRPGDLPTGVLPGPAPRLGDPPGTRYHEIPLAIQDRSFDSDGSLFYPDTRAFFDGFPGPYIPGSDVAPIWNPEFFANTMVVNGRT
jgi:hypothetical protein